MIGISNYNTFSDRIRGCLIGGAVGDALGYPVEFLSWNYIVKHYGKYGKHGIIDYKIDPSLFR